MISTGYHIFYGCLDDGTHMRIQSTGSLNEFEDQTSDEPNNLIIPQKSRDMYEREYKLFSAWCVENDYEKITETVLLTYLEEKGKTNKFTSLYKIYCLLRSMLAVMNSIDITKYSHVQEYLRKSKQCYASPRKSGTLSRQHMNFFIRDAPDEIYLMKKVALIFGVAGAMSCGELCNVTLDDIEDAGTIVSFKIPDPDSAVPRLARIIDEGEDSINFAYYYRKYAALRPPLINHRRFFINYRDGKCSTQVVGINTFGKVPCAVAKFLNLPNPKSYTGRCFKQTCKTLSTTVDGQCLRTLSSGYAIQE